MIRALAFLIAVPLLIIFLGFPPDAWASASEPVVERLEVSADTEYQPICPSYALGPNGTAYDLSGQIVCDAARPHTIEELGTASACSIIEHYDLSSFSRINLSESYYTYSDIGELVCIETRMHYGETKLYLP